MKTYQELIKKAQLKKSIRLNLAFSTIQDLTPLSSLTHLRELNLRWCTQITDISPLASLTNLTKLALAGCENIEEISPLAFMPNLTYLDLTYCKNIEDINPLNSLTNLTKLKMWGCQNIKSIKPLSSLTNLIELDLRGCRNIKDFGPLCHLSKLNLEKQILPSLQSRQNMEDILPRSSIVALHKDEQGRFHNDKGPSISYKEGLNLYHWHGVGIPKKWIIEKLPSVQEALAWGNIEQRRAACEMIGWANIIRELDAIVIDENPDPEIGTLLEVELPNTGTKDRFLKVRCGTGREFVIPVPRNKRTARGANAWTWGLKASQYQPEIRT